MHTSETKHSEKLLICLEILSAKPLAKTYRKGRIYCQNRKKAVKVFQNRDDNRIKIVKWPFFTKLILDHVLTSFGVCLEGSVTLIKLICFLISLGASSFSNYGDLLIILYRYQILKNQKELIVIQRIDYGKTNICSFLTPLESHNSSLKAPASP